MKNILITLEITTAQNEELKRLKLETGKKKSELIRDAINAMIGVYKNVSRNNPK